MHCNSIESCLSHIGEFSNSSSMGYPIVVDVENYADYASLRTSLCADASKACIRVSDHTHGNGFPDILGVLEAADRADNSVVWGISQSSMLKGEEALVSDLRRIIDRSVRGHVFVVLTHCSGLLDKYFARDPRRDRRIVVVDGKRCDLPTIRFVRKGDDCDGAHVDGMKGLLKKLEDMSGESMARNPVISVVMPYDAELFGRSKYAIQDHGDVFVVLVDKYVEIKRVADKSWASCEQWEWLRGQSKSHADFSSLVAQRWGSTRDLCQQIDDVFHNQSSNERWLLWLAMRVFGEGSGTYLGFSLDQTTSCEAWIRRVYHALADVARSDDRFESFFAQRLELLKLLPANSTEMQFYCQSVAERYGKDAVYYLSDSTDHERRQWMKTIDENDWTDAEIEKAIAHASRELSYYIEPFVFDSHNSHLKNDNISLAGDLTYYFNHYKYLKIRNCIDDDFIEYVDKYAIERPYNKLRCRSAVTRTIDKEGVQAYFIDALGAEHLGYIQAKCREYGMISDIQIVRCELPSITSINKEFKERFETRDVKELDDLKHHSTIYLYERCQLPIHLFEELKVIDKELRNIRDLLRSHGAQKAVIFSDHGASRLAVIYRHENEKIELEEKGKHSGRCCRCEQNPNLDQAAYENGWAVLANYERFKGGNKAQVEVHGGASLEEVVVPIVTLTLRPEKVEYRLADQIVKYSQGKVTLALCCNMPMNAPRIQIEGVFYEGVLDSDRRTARFDVDQHTKAQAYRATVWEGNTNTGQVFDFVVERKTKQRDLGL